MKKRSRGGEGDAKGQRNSLRKGEGVVEEEGERRTETLVQHKEKNLECF